MSRKSQRRKIGLVAGAAAAAALPAPQPAQAQVAIPPGASYDCVLANDGSLFTLRITNLAGLTILAPNQTAAELASMNNAQAAGIVFIAGDYNICYGADDGGGGDDDALSDGGNGDEGGR